MGLEGLEWIGPSMGQQLVVDTRQPAGLIHFCLPRCHYHCHLQGRDRGDFYLWPPSEVDYPWEPLVSALISCCNLSFLAHRNLILLHQKYLLMLSDDQFHF